MSTLTQSHATAMQVRLVAAINTYNATHTTPGVWSLDLRADRIRIVWECEAGDPAIYAMYGDEPWRNWGGEIILTAANLNRRARLAASASQMAFYGDDVGHEMVAQWVEWRLEDAA